MDRITGLIIVVCWVIFGGYWCVNALLVKRTAERKSWSSSLAYRVPTLLGALLMSGRFGPRHSNPVLTPHTDAMDVIAAAVCMSGLLVAIWARAILAGNWSSKVAYKQGHELIRTGP